MIKKSLLPIIDVELHAEFYRKYKATLKYGEELEATRLRIVKENPYLIKIIEGEVAKFPKKEHLHIFEIFVLAYMVLEYQSKKDGN